MLPREQQCIDLYQILFGLCPWLYHAHDITNVLYLLPNYAYQITKGKFMKDLKLVKFSRIVRHMW